MVAALKSKKHGARPTVVDPAFIPPARPDPENLEEARRADNFAKRKAAEFADELEAKRKKSRHGKLPEFLNNTTTPAGIAANDPDALAAPWQESPEGAVQHFALEDLARHPDNRHPLEADVVAMVGRLGEEGQLEPVVAWSPPAEFRKLHGIKPALVILSGETRWLAARRLKWQTLQGRLAVGLSPAQALELLAAFNGERKDLDPMQKARLIDRLGQAVAAGGAGLTRQAAAARVGLESAAAASNLVRLLELPKAWQNRVSSGELAWTWARELVPYVPVWKAIEEELERDWKNRETDRWDNAFESRAQLVEQLERVVEDACPRLDRREVWIGDKHLKLPLDVKDPATVERLGIVELELPTGKKGQTAKVPVATNGKAFDELVAEFKAKKGKASAERAGRDEPAKGLTAAEKKAKAAERSKQLGARVAAWRQALLRRELLRKLEEEEDDGFRLVLAYIAGGTYVGPSAGQLLEEASLRKAASRDYSRVYWPCVEEVRPGAARDRLTRAMARQLLADEPLDWRRPILSPALVEGYAEDLAVDVLAAWRSLQVVAADRKLAGEDLLEEFFLLHQTEELRALGDEVGVHLGTSSTRAAMVKLLLSIPRGTMRTLKLPKAIKPVAGVAKAKAKKGRR